RLVARMSGGIVAALGGVVLGGWVFDISLLKTLHPSFATMKANTALLFALTGIDLWLLADDRAHRMRRLLTAAIIAIAALTLAEQVFRVSLGIDQLLFVAPAGTDSAPGRMASATAVSFLFLGLASLFRLVPRYAWLTPSAALACSALA